MRVRTALLALGLVLAGILPVLDPTPVAARLEPGEARAQAQPSIELVDQTAAVARGDRWDVEVRLDGVPPNGFVQLVVHRRIPTREELFDTIDDEDLGPVIFSVSRERVDALPADAAGARTVSLALAPSAAPVTIDLTPGRTYPVEVRASDASGEVLDTLVTYLVVLPGDAFDAGPLSVALVADLRSEPHLTPQGRIELVDGEAADLDAAGAALAATSGTATLLVTPELVDALGAAAEPEAASALEALRRAADGREVLARPYVELSAHALADAGLGSQLGRQLDRGSAVLAAELGSRPVGGTWFGLRGLGPAGLGLLTEAGMGTLVTDAGPLEAPEQGHAPARTVLIEDPGDGEARPGEAVEAAVLDGDLQELLDAPVEPALVTQRVIAALAVTWRGDLTANRGVVLLVDPRREPEVTRALLAKLDVPDVLTPTTLTQLFEAVEVRTDPSGAPVDREIEVESPTPIGQGISARVAEAERRLRGYTAMVGTDSPRPEPLSRHLLVAMAESLSRQQREAHLAALADEVERTLDAVSLPSGGRVTLTARSGTVPLTIQRATDFPVTVRIRLDSTKLEFPGGDEITTVLENETTRIDIAVRTLASGAFPLDIEIASPDGSLTVASTRFTVRSTVVSGVGLFLSIGAGVFLAAWWGSHWRRARRSRRLVPRHAARR